MDQKDIYNQLKNAYFLGNYHKVFEFMKTSPLDEQTLYRHSICSLIVRSFVALGDRQTPEIVSYMVENPDLKKTEEILYPYLISLSEV